MFLEKEKKRIIFYTDCFIFGGCEKPIFKLMDSRLFTAEHDYLVIYRYSREYEAGIKLFNQTVPKEKTRVVRFADIATWNLTLEKKISKPLLLCKARKRTETFFNFIDPLLFFYETGLLYFIFLREHADMVHINNGGYPAALSCRAAAVAAKLAGKKKILFSVNNLAFKRNKVLDFVIDFLVGKSVSVFITGSKAAERALSLERGFDKEKITTIYHGVEPFRILHNERGKRISMVANFEGRKGHKHVVLAVKKLISEHPEHSDLKVEMIGDGSTLKEIRMLIAEERLEKNIELLGRRSDYADFVASSLFLLNPSTGYEDLPYIILEAMALGVPVIGTDVGGIPEEIENNVTGIVVPPGDIEALSKAIFMLLTDQEMRKRMGDAAKRRFQSLFAIDKMTDNYLKLYDSLKP